MILERISSKDNDIIKEVKKLKGKKYRMQNQKFIAEGFRLCSEALLSDFSVPYVFISEECKNKWESFAMKDKLQDITKVFEVPYTILKSICSTDTPQGIAAIVDIRRNDVVFKDGLYVLADKIQDPGNMGTIIRTAHAAGALGVLMTKGTVDIYNEKTLRSTMGSIFHIPVTEDYDLENLNKLKKNNFKLVVSSLIAEKNFYDINLKNKIIIAVGNEGSGISREIYDAADITAKIPMAGGAESLNAAVAASVMIYEYVRQNT